MSSAAPAPLDQSAFRLGHRPWLDGVRGAAILIVLLGHFKFVTGGFLGVDLFFVLSGFLITTLLLEERERAGAVSLRRFYLRRALRLVPALAALLLFGLAFTHFFRPPEEAAGFRDEALVVACYIANWTNLHNTPLPTLGHAWSLSLEEQFYIVWPLVLCALLRMRSRRAVCLCVFAGILVACALRFAMYVDYRAAGKPHDGLMRMYLGLDTRADALLTGCLIGALTVWGYLPKWRVVRFAIAVAATATVALVCALVATQHMGKPLFYQGLFTLVAFGFGSIIVHLLVNPARAWCWILESPPLVGLGRISYGLYLVHVPVIFWLADGRVGPAYPAATLGVALACVGAALVSFYLIERPFLRLKSRFQHNADSSTAPATPAEPTPARRAA